MTTQIPAPDPTESSPRVGWLRAGARRVVPLGLRQSVLAVVLGLVVCFGVILLVADDPGTAFSSFLTGTFKTRYAFGNMIAIGTVLIFTALAATVSFRAGAFNIGTEGQLVLGGLVAAVVVVAVPGPGILAQLVALVCAALAGAAWVALPAWLRIRFGTNEILTTLMFNYIAADLALFLVNRFFRDKTSGAVETPPLPTDLWLTRLLVPSPANVGVILALLVAAGAWLVFDRTRTGRRMEIAGVQPAFAEYLGIRSTRYLLSSLLSSGALAGLGGGVAVLGITHAYVSGFSPQYGFLGITVALIGRLRPGGVVLAAFLYAMLMTGATSMQSASNVPFALVFVLQGVLVLLVTSQRIGGRS